MATSQTPTAVNSDVIKCDVRTESRLLHITMNLNVVKFRFATVVVEVVFVVCQFLSVPVLHTSEAARQGERMGTRTCKGPRAQERDLAICDKYLNENPSVTLGKH